MSGRHHEDKSKAQARKLIRLAGPYLLIAKQLYIQGKDDVIRRCVLPHEVDYLFYHAHDGVVVGHFGIIDQKSKNHKRSLHTTYRINAISEEEPHISQ